MRFRLLTVTVFFIVFLNLLSTTWILYQTDVALNRATGNAVGTGEVQLCINHPPVFGSQACNETMIEGTLYTCQYNATDEDGDTLTFTAVPVPPDNETIFNISSSGVIDFTPHENDVGAHQAEIYIDDGTGCDNSQAHETFNHSVQNTNNSPYLAEPIPDQNVTRGETLLAFYLNDYFVDPDNDPLSYTYSEGLGTAGINVTIRNDSGVIIRGDGCGYSFFVFTATDPTNLSADSNIVTINSECPPEPQETQSSSGGGGGGGGGGGSATPPCKPELVCLEWSECYPNGLQSQKCRDKNGCTEDEIKFHRECIYTPPRENATCAENWICTDWGNCQPDNTQTRECEDLADCGTQEFLPPLTQPCEYIPTCNDGIKNGDEEGVDCGGSCAPCSSIQKPKPVNEKKLPLLLLLGLLGTFLILIMLAFLYRERLAEGLARLGWLLARRHKKTVYLTPAEKQILFDDLTDIERGLEEGELHPVNAYERLGATARKFYEFLLDIPYEFLPEEAEREAEQLPPPLKEIIISFLDRLKEVEGSGFKRLDERLFDGTKEELRTLVCLLAEYELADIRRELPERNITPEMSLTHEIELRLLDTYEAIQFFRNDIAKESYLAILRAYDQLTTEEKERYHPTIHRLYLEIKYAVELEE
ncbi:hypothetical protein D6789_04455 [Candidatus Woesearchaeota archaeon]|nr:MAG: hypothetical protein D6789_04455 [Candidatus Woesearchaeota archaeon]